MKYKIFDTHGFTEEELLSLYYSNEYFFNLDQLKRSKMMAYNFNNFCKILGIFNCEEIISLFFSNIDFFYKKEEWRIRKIKFEVIKCRLI